VITWKILSLFCVLALSFIEFKQKSRNIKWTGLTLCFLIFLIGTVDLLISDINQKASQEENLRSNSRIEWDKSEAILNIMGNASVDDFISEGQQVIIKIYRADAVDVNGINLAKILFDIPNHGEGRKYLNEITAKKLWYAFAREDKSNATSNERENMIEHISFYEKSLKEDHFSGINSIQKVTYEPRSTARYNSLQDLNNTVIIARFVTHTKKDVILNSVNVNLRTKAGPETLSFRAKHMKDNKRILDQVRYVGIVIGKNEFNKRVN
jgi:hypothetical protein